MQSTQAHRVLTWFNQPGVTNGPSLRTNSSFHTRCSPTDMTSFIKSYLCTAGEATRGYVHQCDHPLASYTREYIFDQSFFLRRIHRCETKMRCAASVVRLGAAIVSTAAVASVLAGGPLWPRPPCGCAGHVYRGSTRRLVQASPTPIGQRSESHRGCACTK